MWLLSTSVTLPSLTPRLVDPLWLKLDEPRDEDRELTNFEDKHKLAKEEVATRKAPTAIGLNLANNQGQSFDCFQIFEIHNFLYFTGDGNENGEASSGDEDADASDEAEDVSETSQDGSGDVEMGNNGNVQQQHLG